MVRQWLLIFSFFSLVALGACSVDPLKKLTLSDTEVRQGNEVTIKAENIELNGAKVTLLKDPLERTVDPQINDTTLTFTVPLDLPPGSYKVRVKDTEADDSLSIRESLAFTLLLRTGVERAAFEAALQEKNFLLGDFKTLTSASLPAGNPCNFNLATVATLNTDNEAEAKQNLIDFATEQGVDFSIDTASIEGRSSFSVGQAATPSSFSEGPAQLRLSPALTGKGIRIAIIDTGLGRSNSFSKVTTELGKVTAESFFTSDADVYDDFVSKEDFNQNLQGHGTPVAYLAAGKGFADQASDVEIMPIKGCDASGTCLSGNLVQSVCYALNNAPEGDIKNLIINLSVNGAEPSQNLYNVLEYALEQGASVVVSGGNEGENGNTVGYPAAFGAASDGSDPLDDGFEPLPGLVVVAALNSSGDAAADFSTRAPYIDIAALGEGVQSLQATGTTNTFKGASFAAPQAAFALALLREAKPDLLANNPKDVAVALEQLLKESAQPLTCKACTLEAVGAGKLSLGSMPTTPLAVIDTAQTTSAKAVEIRVLDNDSAPDGRKLVSTTVKVSQPNNGTVTTNLDGTLIYTPDADFVGVDTFVYTVEDDQGTVSNEATVTVTVTPADTPTPPTASFTALPTSGEAPLDVAFNASASTDDGTIETYAWDFGDNSSGAGQSVQHRYTNVGSYTAVLTVTDDSGLTATVKKTIEVVEKGTTNPDKVDIPDPVLRETLKRKLGLEPDEAVTKQNILGLGGLLAEGSEGSTISDLTGLEFATNLSALYLKDNKIVELQPLTNLTKLKELDLSRNSVKDITPLANLTDLSELGLFGNDFSNIAPLANLTDLSTLGLGSNQIRDIGPLANLTGLSDLGLGSNQIEDISPLAKLTGLSALGLAANQIGDIGPLVSNSGFGTGDLINLSGNPLATPAAQADLKTLVDRGVTVRAVVTIPDALLKGKIKEALDLNSDPTTEDMRSLTNLPAESDGSGYIGDLTGLEFAVNLKTLNIYNNAILDITPLVNNNGFGGGDYVDLRENCLDISSGSNDLDDINNLISRGVKVDYDPQFGCH